MWLMYFNGQSYKQELNYNVVLLDHYTEDLGSIFLIAKLTELSGVTAKLWREHQNSWLENKLAKEVCILKARNFYMREGKVKKMWWSTTKNL